MAKPTVTTNPVANRYTTGNERIIEFSSKFGGGLIALRETPDDRLLVSVYNTDATVDVNPNPTKDVIDAATWIVRLFGTDHPEGIAELRNEVTKLREALPKWREANPWYTSPKIGEG
jgi:hypothetical protein